MSEDSELSTEERAVQDYERTVKDQQTLDKFLGVMESRENNSCL